MEISELNRNAQRLQAEIANIKKQVGQDSGWAYQTCTSHETQVRFQELNTSVLPHPSWI